MNDIISAIREMDDFAALGAATKEQVLSAEKALGVTFAEDYKQYLLTFGAATFNEKELTGICNSMRLDVVAVTEKWRKNFQNFPANAYVIEEAQIDNVLTIQTTDGCVYGYGPKDSATPIAGSLYEYLF